MRNLEERVADLEAKANDAQTLDLSRIKLSLWQAMLLWAAMSAIGGGVGVTLWRVNDMTTVVSELKTEVVQIKLELARATPARGQPGGPS